MKGAWHHNTPYEGGQGEKALPPAAPAAAGSTPEVSAALQIAVKEKVDLDAAKEEIKKLKSKLLGGGGGVLHTSHTDTPAFPETWKAPASAQVKTQAKGKTHELEFARGPGGRARGSDQGTHPQKVLSMQWRSLYMPLSSAFA